MGHRCDSKLLKWLRVIVACDGNFHIGNDGDLLFRIPTDLNNFKRMTMGKNLYMGRATFDSMGNLPGRTSHVLSRSEVPEAHHVYHDKIQFLEAMLADPEGFLVGGGSLIEMYYDFIGEFLMTRTEEVFPADTSITDPEQKNFFIFKESPLLEEDGYHYRFIHYVRRCPHGTNRKDFWQSKDEV